MNLIFVNFIELAYFLWLKPLLQPFSRLFNLYTLVASKQV